MVLIIFTDCKVKPTEKMTLDGGSPILKKDGGVRSCNDTIYLIGYFYGEAITN